MSTIMCLSQCPVPPTCFMCHLKKQSIKSLIHIAMSCVFTDWRAHVHFKNTVHLIVFVGLLEHTMGFYAKDPTTARRFENLMHEAESYQLLKLTIKAIHSKRGILKHPVEPYSTELFSFSCVSCVGFKPWNKTKIPLKGNIQWTFNQEILVQHCDHGIAWSIQRFFWECKLWSDYDIHFSVNPQCDDKQWNGQKFIRVHIQMLQQMFHLQLTEQIPHESVHVH